MKSQIKTLGCVSLLTALTFGCVTAQKPGSEYFSDWPAGSAPAEVGKRVADNFLARKFDYQTNPRRETVIYPEVCAAYGALQVAKFTGDKELRDRIIQKFEPLLTETNHLPKRPHVDDRVFGAVPFEIYMQTGDQRFLALGKHFADSQWTNTTPDGITAEARYWVDDMYMISAVQIQAYRATHDEKYLDRAAQTMAAYLDKLQQPNGLFFHAEDSPCYWSRGNGWYAAGMTEVLSELPKNHPQRARIMEGYQKMMAALLKYQGDDGLWHQLIDHPESWAETSGTGMFTFAMVTGVKHGWLDAKTYGPAARKAWLALVKHLDADANVTDVCVGTNKAFPEVGADPAAQVKYYLNRGRHTGDLHGQSPIMWSAAALLR